jgi:hypothetical protein
MNTLEEHAEDDPPKRRFHWKTLIASKFLIISIVVHLLGGVGATFYVVQRIQGKRKLTFQGGPPVVNASQRALEHKVTMAKKKASMSAPAQAKRITTTGLAKIALPEMPSMPHATEVLPNRMAGMGGTGTGLGFGGGGLGSGGGGGGFMLPRIVGDRCSPSARAAAMKAGGGNPKCEESIHKALAYLAKVQDGDGKWGNEHVSAMTGLSLLAFLGHCEKPSSKEFGPVVRKAIDFLLGMGKNQNGKLSRADGNSWVYEHGIATYALGEAYIFTKEPAIAEVLTPAVARIVKGQGPDGGWMYGFNKAVPSDTSVSGWQIQALKAAHLTGLELPGIDESMDKAMDNLMRVRGKKGGFGYRTPEDKWGLTGAAVLGLQIGKGQKGGAVREGLQYILEDEKAPEIRYKGGGANLYAWYYNTQACFQAGGSFWNKWNRAFQEEVLGAQNEDGSWPETGSTEREANMHYTGTGKSEDAVVYRTSLCVLMLEVFYRYLATGK